MQILGKRSKVMLIAIAIAMLVAIGVSFAAWDSMATVKATSGDLSTYANAKVGDEIQFGNYYQSKSELEKKTPITWIVVDKDERTGQLTLMSKYILACGSYFGNYYDDGTGVNWNYNKMPNGEGGHTYSTAEVGDIPYNLAYVDSTVRAYLNNLERRDLGGDGFTSGIGYIPSKNNSTTTTGLLTNVGFSNQKYCTELKYTTAADQALVDAGNKGLIKRKGNNEIYYQRPINNAEFRERPATKGFIDEAFSNEEKSIIVPKVIPGYIGYRWPDAGNHLSITSYVEGTVDKVWIPSATELNIMNGRDWLDQADDSWTNPSDEASSTVFEYFKNLEGDELKSALKATRTELATDGKAGNFSIPIYDKGTTTIKTAISSVANVNNSDKYWTRSPSSSWYSAMRTVLDSGIFGANSPYASSFGVRPCVILKY